MRLSSDGTSFFPADAVQGYNFYLGSFLIKGRYSVATLPRESLLGTACSGSALIGFFRVPICVNVGVCDVLVVESCGKEITRLMALLFFEASLAYGCPPCCGMQGLYKSLRVLVLSSLHSLPQKPSFRFSFDRELDHSKS